MYEKEILSKLMAIELSLSEFKKSQKDILTLEEACDYLGMSRSQMYKLTRKGLIPHKRPFGKIIYFLKSEILEWLSTPELQKNNSKHKTN